MKKKITIILKKNHPSIGKKGKIAKVTLGYAFNYLIPKNIAEIASKKKIKHIMMLNNIHHEKAAIHQIEANNLNKSLTNINKINITKKQGENYQIFGSVNEKEILNIILKSTGQLFDKKQLQLPQIKSTGIYSLTINILNEIQANLKINIIPENI